MVDGEEVPVPLRPIHDVHRAPGAPRIRTSHRMPTKTHRSVVFVVAEPRPPLGHAAVDVPVPPSDPAMLSSTCAIQGFKVVVAALDLDHGSGGSTQRRRARP